MTVVRDSCAVPTVKELFTRNPLVGSNSSIERNRMGSAGKSAA
jgi:hypothetical protein